MKNIRQELQNKMLNEEQVETVRKMIIGSMRDVYVDQGSIPGDGFEQAAGFVAEKIIKKTQMALLQNNVFDDAVKNIYDDKKKNVKKVVKKTTKKTSKKSTKLSKKAKK